MLFLPPEGGNRAVQNLNRPPLGHNRDGTSALTNATPALQVDHGPMGRSYGVDAAFMSFQQHGWGNHAV